jgi:hypothetical protein
VNEEAPRYTLAEAKLELNREECRIRGHDFEIQVRMGVDGPCSVLCSRCGKQWAVIGDQ